MYHNHCDYLFNNVLFISFININLVNSVDLVSDGCVFLLGRGEGWLQECLGIMTSVAVGFRCILNVNLFPLFWIGMSRKLMLFAVSVSKVNLIVGARVLDAL
jgi:hypothetical protein